MSIFQQRNWNQNSLHIIMYYDLEINIYHANMSDVRHFLNCQCCLLLKTRISNSDLLLSLQKAFAVLSTILSGHYTVHVWCMYVSMILYPWFHIYFVHIIVFTKQYVFAKSWMRMIYRRSDKAGCFLVPFSTVRVTHHVAHHPCSFLLYSHREHKDY